MRILQINAVYQTKSTGRIAKEMHTFFEAAGHESYVAYGTENTAAFDPHVFRVGSTLDHKIHALLYRIDRLQGCHSTAATKTLLARIDQLRPDVVLTHNLHSNYLNFAVLMQGLHARRIPVVLALHDCWYLTGGCYHYTATGCTGWLTGCHDCALLGKAAAKKWALNRRLMETVHPTVVATSHWIEGEARRSLLGDTTDIVHIYDWIDQKTFYPRDRAAARAAIGIEDATPLILGVATGWAPVKGQTEMIRVAEAMPYARLILVGHQAVPAAYPDNVTLVPFTDSKESLARLYSAADVFFNPSKQETFGLVSGEALSCGTPIVTYDTTACPEFVTEQTGRIMSSPDDAVPAIRAVLDRSDQRGRDAVAQDCAAFAKANFSMNTNLQAYLDLFETILKKKER